jgi:hypothetical protein
VFARLNAERAASGKPPLGFLNPFIYQNGDAFNDVKLGMNQGAGKIGFSASEGWDAATGFGTPNFPKLSKAAMKAVGPAPVPTPPPTRSPPTPAPPPPGSAHYDKPPCLSDEDAIQVQGVSGVICAPQCSLLGSCPKDTPKGTTALPSCVLSNAITGKSYCALVCTLGGGCPAGAKCQSTSLFSGICTYPASNVVARANLTVAHPEVVV